MIIVCIFCVISIFFGEMWIKNDIEKNTIEGKTKKFCKGKILIHRYHNKGAILNFGQKQSKLVALLSILLTSVAFLFFLFSFGQRGNRLLQIGFSLLLGGAFSNTYDRIKRKYVVDYFSFGVKWKKLQNIVFNLSDFCIAIGAFLIVLGTRE